MKYESNLKSVKNHKVPEWFHDAKFGIFIHWGLYSVPAFAILGNIRETLKKGGWNYHFKNNPYAEWYLNTMKIKDSPTQKYHNETFGEDFTYDDFIQKFNQAIVEWDPNQMADLFQKIGAKYVVLGTKHHDGFCLWPTKYPNPRKKNYYTKRNIVGELTKAVRDRGMKMGLYYSGGLDWTFNETPIQDFQSFITNGPIDLDYIKYIENHFRELIDIFEPIILWNDIGYPPGTNMYDIISYYYNKVPNSLINDRWSQTDEKIKNIILSDIKNFSEIAKKTFIEEDFGKIKLTPPHYDFRTPEYSTFKKIVKDKFEVCRGIGNSFGYNQNETEKDYISVDELVRMLVDIVSKNGNLLLNVGPMANGSIPDLQIKRLLGLGKWLETNGESIFGTRPWIKAEGTTHDQIEVRFTTNNEALYMILLDTPKTTKIIIELLEINKDSVIKILGNPKSLTWKQINHNLEIDIPKLQEGPAHAFKILPKPEIK